ncbi:MAG: excinuclease ABC subunit C [Bacteroidetes bacterium]|nr:excinuclease ABC subunit C [Bacteroidota bacterium]
MDAIEFKQIRPDLPSNPGIYKFLDRDKTILYVGKAKDIKKRVSSYFTIRQHERFKTTVLVHKIKTIEFTIVDTEVDALLLENNLIKKFQPKYNVALKDGKSYPFITIKKERFPRIFSTRTRSFTKDEYYGPYTSSYMVNILLELINNIFQLRNCNLNLSSENIEKKKFKVCLEYHIGNCLGPCEDLQNEEDYNRSIEQIRLILKGNINHVIKIFKKEVLDLAAKYEFEKAQELKDKLDILKKFQNKSTIVNPKIHQVDVFSIVEAEANAFVNYLHISNGSIVLTHTLHLKKKVEESTRDLLLLSITELRKRFSTESNEIIVPEKLDIDIPNIKITVPRKGDKKKLLDLSLKNAKYFKINLLQQQASGSYVNKTTELLERVKKDFKLKKLPEHIECFDNSNLQGTNPVASMVVFRKGKKYSSEYRHYNIKSVEGPDDFASMAEVVHRRYKRLISEKQDLPQLIIVDGGKGQLSAALKSLNELNLINKIDIIAIAKRLEEIYIPGDEFPIFIDKRSGSIRLIQRIRNEAHRFAITFHRLKRKNDSLQSELTKIEGIGPTSLQKLLTAFKSVKKIKETPQKELEQVVGKEKARLLKEYFNSNPT